MKVGIGADHGGFEMKQQLAKLLAKEGHEVVDFGNKVYNTTMTTRTLRSPRSGCGQ
jgi:Ribose 5-phosphate isomerase RpiB